MQHILVHATNIQPYMQCPEEEAARHLLWCILSIPGLSPASDAEKEKKSED